MDVLRQVTNVSLCQIMLPFGWQYNTSARGVQYLNITVTVRRGFFHSQPFFLAKTVSWEVGNDHDDTDHSGVRDNDAGVNVVEMVMVAMSRMMVIADTALRSAVLLTFKNISLHC